ncbi:hypothetical protein TREMEDRAFT_59150 [Tremella mesenterica DSM 1558]|uniref:uncharacterized protein n=1 Tax=Tremella mesenterica (strain ATCC 24925 / CBS 8224 / DSM 1558 / NBRC 9311 / NRRL Y-6157 / RJB 2259-6 / UBC 559-6) TaxID=578456 RepID=UPI0003F49045|nr:uncharacterized protein TREMEDRAFT_59150 [Tremella mesenterica DSM 1558]EIW72990.1 hypothetical protein TREMEDRAFT_59150 [Tremella mesenterica DSM 1558]
MSAPPSAKRLHPPQPSQSPLPPLAAPQPRLILIEANYEDKLREQYISLLMICRELEAENNLLAHRHGHAVRRVEKLAQEQIDKGQYTNPCLIVPPEDSYI